MSFRMKQSAISWFSNIKDKKPLTTQFDLYYLCLMAGLSSGRRSDPVDSDGKQPPEFIKYFVDDYQKVRRLVLGLLLISEIKRLGLEMDEKKDVQDVILKLVDPESQTHLTEEGMQELNKYASGGYDFLAEKLESKPFHAEEFLRTYVDVIQNATAANNNWMA